MSLRLDWCSHEAARYAVMKWHYSKVLPTGKLVKVGVWENMKFIGVIIFSRGASPHLCTKWSILNIEICELTRIALDKHEAPVSRLISIALRFLKKHCPGIRLVVSFADPNQKHVGAIYQASNWIYTGISEPVDEWYINGRWRHTRGAWAYLKNENIRNNVPRRKALGKYRYVWVFDRKLENKIKGREEKYPKRAESIESDALDLPVEGGRCNSDLGAQKEEA